MRKTGTRLLAVLLAVVMVLPSMLIPGMAAEATGFTDVPEGSWYGDAVNYVSEKGYMTGVGDNRFAPNDEVTRAMFVTILARITMAETDGTVSAFTDVPENKWYTGAVSWAAENGIVNGVGDGMFAPGKSITRQDLCTILYRFVNAMDYELTVGEEKTFTDSASVSSYAAEAVRYASSVGLIAGYDDGTFRPKATATRAQMAVIIMRLARLLDGQIVKPEPMPAQSFNGAAGDDMTVSVNAPKGALPENTNMTVSRVTDEAALAAIAEKSGAEIFAAADITFSKNGAELEPEKAVEVQIAMDGIEDLKNPVVYHVLADGNLEYISSEVIPAIRGSGKVLRFYADEFTVYAVGDNIDTVKTLTVNFYEKDGTTIISSQVIRLDQLDDYIEKGMEFVHDPGVPAITDTQSFEGWQATSYSETDYATYSDIDTTDNLSVANINDFIETNKDKLKDSSKNLTLNYTAMVFDVVFVTFHDQGGVVIRLESIHLDENTNEGEYEVNLSYSPFKGGWAHIGWTRTINNTGDEPTYPADLVYYENGDTITLTQSIDLYPYLKQGYWLIFDNNIDQDQDDTSASFTSPKYYGKDESAALPTDYGDANNDGVDHDAEPYRVGYTFGGWYTDKTFTTAYTARQLTADTTVYAKWTPRTDTPYMVVIWTQRADDPVDSNDLNNNYDFYKAIETRKGTTGATANFLTADTTLGGATGSELGYYFTYNQAASDTAGKTIKGDGTTVLNVYYNRRTITINFWTGSGMTTRWSGQGYVEAENGAYYYYTAPYETGYYLCGTGPNTSSHPNTGDGRSVSGYYWGYKSSSSSGYTGYSSSEYDGISPVSPTDAVNAYSSGDTAYVVRSTKGYYYERYTGTSSYSYYPIYYSYTAPYPTGYYSVGQGPTPTATGTHNLTTLPNPMVGLYQAPLTNWPSDPATGYEWAYDDAEDNKHYGITLRDCYDIPDNTHTTVWNIYAEAKDYTAYKTIHWMCEDLEGSFAEKTTTQLGYSSSKSQTQYYDDGKFLGFKAYGHNLSANSTETSGGFVAYTANAGISTNDAGQNAYIYFTRRAYDLSYMSQGHTVKTQSGVKYQQPLADFAAYEPTNGPAGYYFDGWYKDPGFEEEFDWTDDMPNNNVAVYAKWTKMRFRVTLDYTGGDSSAQVTFPANQASTFRVYYGEKVRDTAIIAATREGYTLLGWYLDPNGEHPFNFAEAITDQTYNMDFSYVYGTGRSGTDAVTGNPYNDDALDDNGNPKYADVIGKVTIYALWRQDSVGSDGIRIRYDAIENSGYFPVDGQATDPRVIIRDDPNIYTDHAKAFTQVASTPEDQDNYRFLYWVVMQPVKDSSGNVILNQDGTPQLEQTAIKVYPGQTFTVDYNYIVQTDAYKITWVYKNPDGSTATDVTTVTKNALPQHTDPSGYVSDNLYYPFDHWDPTIAAATANATYTAVYGEGEELAQHQFTVTWKNWDGTELARQTYYAGQTPSYPNATPTRPDDSEYTYTFSGWTPAITVVSGDVTYTATYTEAEKTYTVTFHANGGIFGSTETQTVSNVTKGTLFRDIFPTTNPTHSTYSFFGWFTAATGGTEIEGTEEFDGTMTNVYAHWYQRTAEKDTSGTFIEGDCYCFRSTYSSTNYYMNSATTGAKLTGSTGTSIPATAQWIPKASSSGGYTLENFGNRNTWLYDYTSDTDYLACSDSNGYRMYLGTASSTSGTFYLYTGSYYVYFDGTNYQWSTSTSYRTAFTVMHVYNKDMNASTTNSTGDASISAAVAAPAAAMTAQKAVITEQKLTAPAATRGNTQPVKATSTYTLADSLEIGSKYLLVVESGNTGYVMKNTCNSGTEKPNAEVVTATNNQISGNYSAYEVLVGGSAGAYTFQNSLGLLGITNDSNNNLCIGNSYTTWSYTSNNLVNTSSAIATYKYVYINTTGLYLNTNSANYASTVKFYKLDDGGSSGGEEPTTSDLDEALNVDGGNLHFRIVATDSYPWYVPAGASYAQSGNKGISSSNSYLYLDLEMQAGDKLSFKYWVSSETQYDLFVFHDDGTEAYNSSYVFRYAGTYDWTTYEYTAATSGTYHFVWQFRKDSSGNVGEDCARLDDVAYIPTTPTYTIIWNYKASDGTDASVTNPVEENTLPTAPTVPETYTLNGTTYRFTGWDRTIVPATEATAYTAQYEIQSYTITWSYKNASGEDTGITTQVAPGATPEPGFTPASYISGGDEYRFTGWTPAIAAATGPATYTAQYTNVSYTITWHIKTDGGNWTTETTRVAEGNVPSYNSHPVWEDENGDEWMFSGWAASENGEILATLPAATEDTAYYAQYTKVGVYTYTMYLHAVYGLYNKSGTHVTWFGNNDPTGATAGVQIERDKGMQINIGYDIPKPTDFVNGVKDYAADSTQSTPATTNLTYEDHVFLGWARLEADPNDTANAGSAHPDLTEKDLYLKWDATSGKYYLNTNADGEGDPVWSTELYTKIAADEMTPYHDMYAVWAGFYYIYHSSDGTLEAVQAPFDASETKDIVSEVNNGYLYGGYYKAYRGAQTIEGGEATMKSRINSEVLQSTGFWDYTNSKVADGAINSIDLTAAGAVDYDATTDKIMLDGSLVRLWNKTDAYGKTETGDAWAAVDGRAMTPVVGEIYYLREVPNVYLPNVALAICDDKDENGNVTDQISKVYVLSASDELLYTTTQFSLAGSKVKATVSKQFIVDYREPNPDGNGYTPKTETFTPAELREGLSGKIGWVLSYEIPVANLKTGTGLVVKPSWTTYDGVTVYGDEFTYKISSDGTTLERNQ